MGNLISYRSVSFSRIPVTQTLEGKRKTCTQFKLVRVVHVIGSIGIFNLLSGKTRVKVEHKGKKSLKHYIAYF